MTKSTPDGAAQATTAARIARPLALALLLAIPWGAAAAKTPAARLVGIGLGMTLEEVSDRLEKVGTLESSKEGPAGAKQFWQVRDRRYAWLAVRFDGEKRVEWVTAIARQDEGRRPVRYRDIGDLEQARFTESYIYTWVVKGKDGESYAVTARGTDPEVISSISIYHPTPTD